MEHSTVDIEGTVNSIEQILNCLPRTSSKSCIFRVPKKLRDVNEKAYTPQMVSIGPLHHGNTNLENMEEQKMRCLKEFLAHTGKSVRDCFEMIGAQEENIRNCYEESIKLNSNEFVKMILVDSSFVIESMRSHSSGNPSRLDGFMKMDLILLENQLPFFVLEELFNLPLVSNEPINSDQSSLLPSVSNDPINSDQSSVLPSVSNDPINSDQSSLLKLSVEYFKDLMLIENIPDNISGSDVKHFVDLMVKCHLPPSEGPPSGGQSPQRGPRVQIQNATGLCNSGVNIRVGSSRRLFDIQYDRGVLRIPLLCIQDSTEPVVRNLIAFELLIEQWNTCILDYIYFMDSLIDTPKDVDILVKKGVLDNWLGDNSAVAKLFNNLTTESWLWGDNFYYSGVSRDLDKYCQKSCHNWTAALKRDHFSSPWKIASVVAATILLVLTFIQTVSSVKGH